MSPPVGLNSQAEGDIGEPGTVEWGAVGIDRHGPVTDGNRRWLVTTHRNAVLYADWNVTAQPVPRADQVILRVPEPPRALPGG